MTSQPQEPLDPTSTPTSPSTTEPPASQRPSSSPFFQPSSRPSQPTSEDTSNPQPESFPSPEMPSDPADDGSDSRSQSDRSKTTGRPSIRELAKVTKTAVATVTGVVHQLLTAEGTLEREAGLWLADSDDISAIGDPLASIAARRLPEGAQDPETGDIVRLVLGVAGYLGKNLMQRRGIRATYAAGVTPPDETAQPDEAPAGAVL